MHIHSPAGRFRAVSEFINTTRPAREKENKMVYDRLVDILLRVKPNIDKSQVNMDADLVMDLGIDSLSMMLLAISVEDEFNIRFDDNPNFKTVKEICDYVSEKAQA